MIFCIDFIPMLNTDWFFHRLGCIFHHPYLGEVPNSGIDGAIHLPVALRTYLVDLHKILIWKACASIHEFRIITKKKKS